MRVGCVRRLRVCLFAASLAGCGGSLAPVQSEPASPVDYGRRELEAVLHSRAASVQVLLASDPAAVLALAKSGSFVDDHPESYVLLSDGADTLVIGRDA